MKPKWFLLVLAAIVIVFAGCQASTTNTTTTTAAATTTTSTALGTSTTAAGATTTTTVTEDSTTTTAGATTTTAAATTTTTSSGDSTTTTTVLVSDGLVAYYAFDESSGTTASDSSGNDLDGTVYGATSVTGKVGNALEFDGTNDYVGIPASGEAAPAEIANLDTGSIAVWFKYEGTPPMLLPILYMGASPEVINNNEGCIIELGHAGISDQSQNLFYTVTMAGSAEPVFCYDSRVDITPEVWNHFVVTVGSYENTGYLNGEEMVNRRYNFPDEDEIGPSYSYFLADVTDGILSIGYGRFGFITAGQFYYFDGTIDELRIYDRVLTSTEVEQLYLQ